MWVSILLLDRWEVRASLRTVLAAALTEGDVGSVAGMGTGGGSDGSLLAACLAALTDGDVGVGAWV